MSGFVGFVAPEIPEELQLLPSAQGDLIVEEIRKPGFYCRRTVNGKFEDDKVFGQEGSYCICVDGVIMNRGDLQVKIQAPTFGSTVARLYRDRGMEFLRTLRGNFNGVLYDRDRGCCHLFSDPLGTKPVFYCIDQQNSRLVFGSDFAQVVACLRLLRIEPQLSLPGAYCLLTFGYMVADYTLVKEVRRLPPGSFLTFSPDSTELHQYHQFSSVPQVTGSKDEILLSVDKLFRQAIRREYEKDREYGYHHIATLSGGMDSRMSVVTAWKMGYRNILCVTFSQSDYLDERIAREIAADFGMDHLFHSLDGGGYLEIIEELVRTNGGLILFSGAAHTYTTVAMINHRKFGLMHMGQLGGTGMGGYLTAPAHTPVDMIAIRKAMYSTRLMHRIPEEVYDALRQYENSELMGLYTRGVNGVFNGYRAVEGFTEFASAAHDTDFIGYCLRIDPSIRYGKRLYREWILQFLPEAASYRYERTGVPITAGRMRVQTYAAWRWIRRKIAGRDAHDSMNPMEYWFYTNPALRACFDQYYATHFDLLSPYPQLQQDARLLYADGTALEKSMVLTLLAALHLIIRG